jgi:NADP-dependent 3-hydroxy acid dehydrogenase YdfG
LADDARRDIASRTVTPHLQESFARLSGDFNPMHMDPVAARRTLAGQPVVHGIHSLLWALDTLAQNRLLMRQLMRIQLRLLKWIYLGDEAVLTLPAEMQANPERFQIQVNGFAVLSGGLTYADTDTVVASTAVPDCTTPPLSSARLLSFAQMTGFMGEAYVAPADAAGSMFPALAALVGARAVAELAATSYVVGMEAPGLYSTFSKLDVTFRPQPDRAATGLAFEVNYADERFSKARIGVSGAALEGTLEVFVRSPPAVQAAMEQVAASGVARDEFSSMTALIIGGSRGLGEVTAKLVAAGGGRALITYSAGRREAEDVAEQIRAWGGQTDTLPYDVLRPAAPQLASLPALPTHLFYFATGPIFQPRYQVFSSSVFEDFLRFYVDGFYDLCVSLKSLMDDEPGQTLRVYYPSSIAIEERPPGMTEYSMAKAAGELLCQDINVSLAGVNVSFTRLPRLPTDQTSSVVPTRGLNPLDILLPILRERMG